MDPGPDLWPWSWATDVVSTICNTLVSWLLWPHARGFLKHYNLKITRTLRTIKVIKYVTFLVRIFLANKLPLVPVNCYITINRLIKRHTLQRPQVCLLMTLGFSINYMQPSLRTGRQILKGYGRNTPGPSNSRLNQWYTIHFKSCKGIWITDTQYILNIAKAIKL